MENENRLLSFQVIGAQNQTRRSLCTVFLRIVTYQELTKLAFEDRFVKMVSKCSSHHAASNDMQHDLLEHADLGPGP